MLRVFNCGIGMIVIADENDVERLSATLGSHGETVYRIGVIRERNGAEPQAVVV